MNDSFLPMSIPAESTSRSSTPTGVGLVMVWILTFSLWHSWESAIRISLDHRDWNATRTLHYVSANTAYGVVWSLLLGSIHATLMFLSSRIRIASGLRNLLTPAAALPWLALLIVPLLFVVRNYLVPTSTSQIYRWGMAAVLLTAVYAGGLLISKRVAALVRMPGRGTLLRTWCIFLVFPIVCITAFQSVSQWRASEQFTARVRAIVLISVDTLRSDFVGAYGATNVNTPVMDLVASEGALFEHALSPIALTGPSHASMFTGQSPLVHGLRHNGQPLPKDAITLAERLRDAGFQTAAFISAYPLQTINSGLNQGFQTYDEQLSLYDFFNETFYGNIAHVFPFISPGTLRQAPEVTDAALGWLQSNIDKPFFIFIHYFDPHYPYGHKQKAKFRRDGLSITAAPSDIDVQKRLYAREVELVDNQIGRIVALLKNRGIFDQTLFIVTADHGEGLGEHGYYYGHGAYLYEPFLRVPMILRYPSLIPKGTIVSDPISLMDIHKTVTGAAGLNPAPKAGGTDLINVIEKPEEYGTRIIVSHNFIKDIHSLRMGSWKLIKNTPGKQGYELYDLENDPGETKNLAEMEPATLDQMRQTLDQWLASAGSGKMWTPDQLTPEQMERLRSLGYVN